MISAPRQLAEMDRKVLKSAFTFSRREVERELSVPRIVFNEQTRRSKRIKITEYRILSAILPSLRQMESFFPLSRETMPQFIA